MGAPIVAALYHKSWWWLTAAILVASLLYAIFRTIEEGKGIGIMEAQMTGRSVAGIWLTKLFFCFATCATIMIVLFGASTLLRGLL